MRLIVCFHSAKFPKIHAAIVKASFAHHCELPGVGTVFLLSFVRPLNFFFESRILVKNGETLFLVATAPPLVHKSMLLYYYYPVCLPSESCQILIFAATPPTLRKSMLLYYRPVITFVFMFNSAEHEIYPAHKC